MVKLTKGITVHFRSALELMRMINMVKNSGELLRINFSNFN